MDSLEANDADISVLSGLEFAVNLTYLSLNDNNITAISTLAGLTNLTRLWLSNNSIENISSLSKLTNLKELWLWNNQIEDISTLSGLTRLTRLSLGRNKITDISALAGLTNLKLIILNGNNISDLAPLVANTGLGRGSSIDVTNNPLNAASESTHIPTLQARGVSVFFDEFSATAEPQIYNDNVLFLHVAEDLAAGNLPLKDYATRIYRYFNDAFDFLMFVSNLPEADRTSGYIGRYSAVKNDVEGIGLSIFASDDWGSAGKLQGVIEFPSFSTYYRLGRSSLFEGPTLHEVMNFRPFRHIIGSDAQACLRVRPCTRLHRWANFILPSSDPGIGPHWGFTSVNGNLGGFDIANLVDHGGGRYTAGDIGVNFNTVGWANTRPFSPVELYLAGLIPPEEVPDFVVAEDAKWLRDTEGRIVHADNGSPIFTASRVKTYTLKDITAEHGRRVPDASQAQKDFRAAVVLLIDENYPPTWRNLKTLSDDVSWFSHVGEDQFERCNFYETTGGRGTITMDGLSLFKRSTGANKPAASSFGTPPSPIVDHLE